MVQTNGEKVTSRDADGQTTETARGLTWRAVLVALTIACVATVLMCYHDGHITQRNVTSQNFIAPMAMGVMLFFVGIVNALFFKIHRGLALSGRELGVVLALVIVCAPIPRYFAHNLVGTIGYTRSLIQNNDATFREVTRTNIFVVIPDHAMLDNEASAQFDATVSERSGQFAPIDKIPWSVWAEPMLFWSPLMLVFMVMSASFGFVLYRQWAHRELVPYPLAQLMADMVRKSQDRAMPDLFYNRLFWMGAGLMLFIFGINGLAAHFDKMIEVPTSFNYIELSKTFPFLRDSQEGYSLLRGTFYFTMIAAAVLLPAEISFTAWFTWPLMITGTYFYYVQTGERFQHHHTGMINSGSWIAMAMLIVYAGRVYYMALCRRALGFSSREQVEDESVWVFRIYLASMAAFIAIIVRMGLPLDLAFLYTIGLMVMFLVMSRLVTEMGIVWLPESGGGSSALGMMLLFLGQKALGVHAFSLLAIIKTMTTPVMVSTMFFAPAVGNAAWAEHKLTGRNDSIKVAIPVMVLMLIFSCVTLIYFGYSHDGNLNDIPSRLGMRDISGTARRVQSMITEGRGTQISEAELPAVLNTRLTFSERWGNLEPYQGLAGFFLTGFGLVMMTGWLRLKFPRFPLHPLPLVLFGTWLMSRFWFSFLIGWLIKKALLKIGGGRLFEQSRPFFVGIVAGQVMITMVWVMVNLVMFRRYNFDYPMDLWRFFFQIYST